MAEEVVKAKEFGSFTNKGDMEDPIITVQRFLNIYRQLHIFNTKKHEEFNQMILDLPDEVRSKFTAIPGGALLQAYAEEVEAQHGITRNFDATVTIKDYSDEIAKAKIFAQAMAEAQAKFSPPAQQVIQQAPVYAPANPEADKLRDKLAIGQKALEEAKKAGNSEKAASIQKDLGSIQEKLKSMSAQPMQSAQAMMPAPALSGELKVVADKTFAKEIAAALAQAMQIVESQRQAEAPQGEASSEILTKIVEFSEESNKKNLEVIARTISESQIKLAQMIIENNAAQAIRAMPMASMPQMTESAPTQGTKDPAASVEASDTETSATQQAPVMTAAPMMAAAPMPPVQDIISGVVKAQTEQLSNMISTALKESQQLSSKTIVNALSSMQQDNKKMVQIQKRNATLKAKTEAVAPKPLKLDNMKTLASGKVVTAELKEEIAKAGLDNVLFDIDDIETPSNGISNPRKISEMTEVSKDFVIDKHVAPPAGKVFEEHKEPSEGFSAPKLDDNKPKNTASEEEWEWIDNNNSPASKELQELENKPGILDENNLPVDDDFESGYDEAPSATEADDEDDDEDYVWHEDPAQPAPQPIADAAEDEGEWEWEYEEVDEDGAETTTLEPAEDGDADDEWEWEYEEVEEDSPSA